jgi:quinol monooxygenase YgiN
MTFKIGDTIHCIEYFYAKVGFRDKLIESLLELIEPTRAENGCLQYDLLQDKNDENIIILLVKFIDQKSMTQHEQQPYIKHFAEYVMPNC